MRKIFVSLTVLATMAFSATASENPFFGKNQNLITINIGQGVNSFGLIPAPDLVVPFNMAQFMYSQPATFFRLPARQNISFTQTIGYGTKYEYTDYQETFEWNWSDYATQIVTLSWDFAIYHNTHWYFGAGAGVAIQGKQNKREATKFLLPFKLFAGYKINDHWNIELFTQHYSNGDTGGVSNFSYNFWGMGVGYSF